MRALIVGFLVLIALCGNARAFDCKHPKTPPVAVVCSDPELLRLTDARQRAWDEARGRAKGEAKSALIADQRRWLRSYPQACGVAAEGEPPASIDKAVQECFKRADTERIAYLRAYGAAGAPAPAAGGKPEAAAKPDTAKPEAPAARWHLKFTFACQTTDKLAKVLGALARSDINYALAQSDCLPVPEGREAILLAVAGKVAKIRLCSAEAGCTDVYADAATVLDSAGNPVAK